MLKKLARRAMDGLAFRIAIRIGARKDFLALERTLVLTGGQLARNARQLDPSGGLSQAEFRVYSQFGEDGIIQYLISKTDVRDDSFVEFGVQNYVESNTRFLLMNNNWRGLVIDSSADHIEYIRKDPLFWRHDLTALCAFITRENINEIIGAQFNSPELGLLSIDIDGNDYWVWQAIAVVEPTIVVCEYNSVFGVDRAVTVPYVADFDRAKVHYSHLYFGASLLALCRLADAKGYAFVGSNSSGVNAFFVRKDRLGSVRPVSPVDGYVESRVRESRDRSGRMSHLSGIDRLREIQDLPLLDVDTGDIRPISELFASRLTERCG